MTTEDHGVTGSIYACCETKDTPGWEITLNGCYGDFCVDMWRPDEHGKPGDFACHWTRYYTTRAAAVQEYNKWAKTPEVA